MLCANVIKLSRKLTCFLIFCLRKRSIAGEPYMASNWVEIPNLGINPESDISPPLKSDTDYPPPIPHDFPVL